MKHVWKKLPHDAAASAYNEMEAKMNRVSMVNRKLAELLAYAFPDAKEEELVNRLESVTGAELMIILAERQQQDLLDLRKIAYNFWAAH